MADSRLVVSVTCRDEHDGDEMVRYHLHMILPALLDVDDQDLLQPEGPLAQHVRLRKPVKFSGGPVGPQLLHVEVVGRGRVQVLYCYKSASQSRAHIRTCKSKDGSESNLPSRLGTMRNNRPEAMPARRIS